MSHSDYFVHRARGETTRALQPDNLGDHIDRLYRAARALCGSREEAEDLVQDTLACVLRKPRVLRSEDDIGYLLRALRNTFFNQRRNAARQVLTTPFCDDLDAAGPTVADQAQTKVELERLYRAIRDLRADFRDAVVAIDLLGLSYRQAALALSVKEATITTRLHRARQRLAIALSTPAVPPVATAGLARH